MEDSVETFENALKQKVVRIKVGNLYVSVTPHTSLGIKDPETMEVFIFKGNDKNGPDYERELNSTLVEGTEADAEEIADTYANRLKAGVKPKNLFRDTEEANIANMRKILDKISEKK